MALSRTSIPRHRRTRVIVPAMLLAAAGAASQANAQWTVVSLHPTGARTSEASGIENGQQVGFADFDAVLWTGTADSMVVLDPDPTQAGRARCVQGGVQGGSISVIVEGLPHTHAGLWTGTPGSFVDLHPTEVAAVHSQINAMDGGVQVGNWLADDGGGGTFSTGRPCLWSGTPESFVDLTPPGFFTGDVLDISGNQQVGAQYDNFLANACMWTGTAESFVNLDPGGTLGSVAQCTDGVHQYGVAVLLEGANIGARVGYWTGSAESFVDMTPPDSFGGAISAVDGSQQVGSLASDLVGSPPFHAALWNGTAESYVNLDAFVPAGYSGSQALGIWHDPAGFAWIVGSAVNSDTGEPEAIMWVPARPGADLITDVAGPADCTVPPGGAMNYTIRVTNGGLDASGPVTVTVDLPGDALATYASATPAPAAVTPTSVVFDLPALAGGASADISVTLTAVSGLDQIGLSAAAATTADYDPANNGDSTAAWTLQQLLPGEYVEAGDAPELAGGQAVPAGEGALTAIEGGLKQDADIFQIRVDDWSIFSAIAMPSQVINACQGVTSGAIGDSELLLFDASGHGITYNDDFGGLSSQLFSGDPGLVGRTNGEIVWLAISQYNYLPTSGGNLIWNPDPATVTREPDGPGAAGAVDGWTDTADGTGAFFYRIELTGVSGVPSCAADLDNSGGVDVFDLLAYLDLWFTNDPAAELTGDAPASIDVFDLLAYLDGWFAGC